MGHACLCWVSSQLKARHQQQWPQGLRGPSAVGRTCGCPPRRSIQVVVCCHVVYQHAGKARGAARKRIQPRPQRAQRRNEVKTAVAAHLQAAVSSRAGARSSCFGCAAATGVHGRDCRRPSCQPGLAGGRSPGAGG